jgi:hypothetical protein
MDVKTNRKITIGDILYMLFILFSSLMMIGNTIGAWWQLTHFGFSIKYLSIAIVVTAVTVFWFYITFTQEVIISITKIKKNNGNKRQHSYK